MTKPTFDPGATGPKPMGGMEFIKLAQQLVARDWNTKVITLGQTFLHPDEVYPVFISKDLNNNKGTFATPRNDGLYYEITRNGNTNEAYVDRYYKQSNEPVNLGYYDANGRLQPLTGIKKEQLNVIEEVYFGKSKLEIENEILRKELTRYSGESFEKES